MKLQTLELVTSNQVFINRAPLDHLDDPGCSKAIGFSPQTGSKALLLNSTLTQLIDCGEVELGPN